MSALLPHHARELVEGSGIHPDVVARRGCRSVTSAEARALGFADYQARAGLLLPRWTLAGVQVGHLLKPDRPRTDERDKPVKYEFPAGAPPAWDVHPDARPLLRGPSVPIYFTEGMKKEDAAWSRGVLCVDIGSVWMFLNDRLVVPDLDEIDLAGRLCRVAFDSDVTRKPAVAEALLRFCAVLHRRGARVEVVSFAEGADGAKIGFDDYFVHGGTVPDLDRLARPWTGEGPGVWLRGANEHDADELRRQRDAARDDASALVRAILNPDVSRSELVAVTSATAQVLAKQQRGEVEADGTVVLTAAEIANDWRPAPAKGERVAPTNPAGDRPRLARERVKPLLAPAVERGLLVARSHAIPRRHTNGSTYRDTVWAFDPIPSIAAALSPWAAYHPDEPTLRKSRTPATACPHCHEVHPVVRRDACTGCGSVLAERTMAPASDNLSEANATAEKAPPGPPRNVVRSFIGGNTGDAGPAEPVWLAEAPAAPEPNVHELLAAADHADDPDRLHDAADGLFDRLADEARARGRTPRPKPRPSWHADADAGAAPGFDRWTP